MDINVFDNLFDHEIKLLNSSSFINSLEQNLGCVDGEIIGTGSSDYTTDSTSYNLLCGGKNIELIDIPGIEGDESRFEETISKAIQKSHAIFYVNGSGKKIEKSTCEKMRKYMHDGTSVYAVFNVHCKAKKERLKGIDREYSEELNDIYYQYTNPNGIIKQTEVELKDILSPKNFKYSICVNGLLSFCALAIDKNGKTTIVEQENKYLRNDQKKFIKEYSSNMVKMKDDSHINEIKNNIDDNVKHFDKYIYDENIKKLKKRLEDMTEYVNILKNEESQKINVFFQLYDQYKSHCDNAKFDFEQSIKHIGSNTVNTIFDGIQDKLYEIIETEKRNLKKKEIQKFLEEKKNQICEDIQKIVNDKIEEAFSEYFETIKDAQNRFMKDCLFEQNRFTVQLSEKIIVLDMSFIEELKQSFSDMVSSFFSIASITVSYAFAGSCFTPVLGTIIGATIGFISGVASSIWSFFASDGNRINKAKEKLNEALDEQKETLSCEIDAQIKKAGITKSIEKITNGIYEKINKQEKSLSEINLIMDSVLCDLNIKLKALK